MNNWHDWIMKMPTPYQKTKSRIAIEVFPVEESRCHFRGKWTFNIYHVDNKLHPDREFSELLIKNGNITDAEQYWTSAKEAVKAAKQWADNYVQEIVPDDSNDDNDDDYQNDFLDDIPSECDAGYYVDDDGHWVEIENYDGDYF